MANTPPTTQEADPITAAFVVDRQAFWTRFTGFTTYVAIGLVALLILLWYFIV